MQNSENGIFRNYRIRTFRNIQNKWLDQVLTVRFVISVVENSQGQNISSKFEDRLLGHHPTLDFYEERVTYYVIDNLDFTYRILPFNKF